MTQNSYLHTYVFSLLHPSLKNLLHLNSFSLQIVFLNYSLFHHSILASFDVAQRLESVQRALVAPGRVLVDDRLVGQTVDSLLARDGNRLFRLAQGDLVEFHGFRVPPASFSDLPRISLRGRRSVSVRGSPGSGLFSLLSQLPVLVQLLQRA